MGIPPEVIEMSSPWLLPRTMSGSMALQWSWTRIMSMTPATIVGPADAHCPVAVWYHGVQGSWCHQGYGDTHTELLSSAMSVSVALLNLESVTMSITHVSTGDHCKHAVLALPLSGYCMRRAGPVLRGEFPQISIQDWYSHPSPQACLSPWQHTRANPVVGVAGEPKYSWNVRNLIYRIMKVVQLVLLPQSRSF